LKGMAFGFLFLGFAGGGRGEADTEIEGEI
jgi:hypothetical protein